MKEKLKIIPLGGLNEIGKNMTVIEYGNDIVVIDCGVAFPDDDMLGVDLVIPDTTYLKRNLNKLRGYVITHGGPYRRYSVCSARVQRTDLRDPTDLRHHRDQAVRAQDAPEGQDEPRARR